MEKEILLIKLYREGNQSAVEELMEQYKGLVNSIARSFFLKGVDREDLIQEGMIGLFKAIDTFNLQGNVSFITYAHECIKNRMLDCIRSGMRLKNKTLTDSVPISEAESAHSGSPTPEEIAINAEEVDMLKSLIATSLTDAERGIFDMYCDGKSYVDIAQAIGKNVKFVDNTLQKIRRKIKAGYNKK